MIYVLIVLIPYLLWLVYIYTGYPSVTENNYSLISHPVSVSIIIPYRNENETLPELLNSLRYLNRTQLDIEIICVDDHSELPIHCPLDFPIPILFISSAGQGKKQAIETGVRIAKSKYILTTDADCVVQPDWVKQMVCQAEKNQAVMVSGRVRLSSSEKCSSFLYQWQITEFNLLIMMGGAFISRNNPLTCNGANLLYLREAFIQSGGYKNQLNKASGDDEMLMHKLYKTGIITFCPSDDSVVNSMTQVTWNSLNQQHIRWSSKHTLYTTFSRTFFIYTTALIQLLAALSPVFFIYFPIASVTGMLIKIMAEYIISQRASVIQNQSVNFYLFLIQSFLYPYWAIYIYIKAQSGSYLWKGRTLR